MGGGGVVLHLPHAEQDLKDGLRLIMFGGRGHVENFSNISKCQTIKFEHFYPPCLLTIQNTPLSMRVCILGELRLASLVHKKYGLDKTYFRV